ncbi:MAG TPA: glycogen/starch/alpha-glucan phosphorylase [Xanthobacteraceae bacterium]|nr:glycogen/starch/alpha-glucan phosphorylase [Xanthobacteraceae bacterium]
MFETVKARRARESGTSDAAQLRDAILAKLTYSLGKDAPHAGPHDWFMATALAIRDRVIDRWMRSTRQTYAEQKKRVYYLSVEFLLGRLLFDTLGNLGITETAREALAELGVDIEELRAIEPDQALGNGGLGRLAACFMDSMASLALPAYGYGIRYDHGLFKQHISDGWQHEVPEDWLAFGNPWEFERPEVIYQIGFGGAVEYIGGDDETARALWYPAETVRAEAYDTPITGWRGRHVNTLRLWSARANDPIHLYAFNQGDFLGAMAARAKAEAISKVLYPSDATPSGQELRLRQEYFFTSASLQDLVRRHLDQFDSLSSLPDHVAIQLNDTHPAIAVAELMRLLIDDHECSWNEAWRITTNTLNYTNHTLLPEALESWPVELMTRLLPRLMQIIYVINWDHLKAAEQSGVFDPAKLAAVSVIQENGDKRVRMGHLAFIGSHRINGVSALHTDLMRKTVFRDLDALRPGRIVNKTNGISFRRWLQRANPALTQLLVDTIGERMLDDPEAMRALESKADDPAFQRAFAETRLHNKENLARCIRNQVGIRINPAAMFDVQIKRIHEYKRQLLNILETVALYQAIRKQPHAGWVPRVKIIAGKAAASYARAKLIIKLAHDVARVINSDPLVGEKLKLVFLPNYNVSLAEAIIPAADLSEQISTAGMEASGTGNMKLGLNGALTIGTLDGANIEILEQVGPENIFIFGLTADQVAAKRRAGITGQDAAAASPVLMAVLDSIGSGAFSPDDKDRFHSLVDTVLVPDHFMVAADFEAYWQAQRQVDWLWREPPAWWKASILNTARMGFFSSDRAIREYAREIWGIGELG